MKRSLLLVAVVSACRAAPAMSGAADAAASASAVASSAAETDAGRKLTLADVGGEQPHLGVRFDDPNEGVITYKPTGPRGLAATGNVSSQPAISEADRVVAATRPKFRMCYQKGLDADPKLAGTADLDVTVGPNGEVQTASAKPSIPALTEVAECAAHVMKGVEFTPPGSSSKLTFKVSFSLDPKQP